MPEIGLRVLYRPAIEDGRKRFRYEASFLQSESFVHDWMASHVVATNWPLTPLEAMWRLDDESPADYQRLCLIVQGLAADDSGVAWREVEREWSENLRRGVELELLNPKLARRSCDDCLKYWYSEKTGEILRTGSGDLMLRDGPVMCQTPEGCLKGTPENPRTLNKANRWAWRFHRDCEAVGSWPDDPIVRRNADIIRQAAKAVEAKRAAKK